MRAINRGVDAIHADKEGGRSAMIKWAGLNPDMVGKIGLPLFEKAISEKDVQVTMDLTYQVQNDIPAAQSSRCPERTGAKGVST